MVYLATFAECFSEGHKDEAYSAWALGLFDSEDAAISLVVRDLWNSGAGHDKPGDWLRYDVYSYDGEDGDADSVYESLDAIDQDEDGDVLHIDVSADGVRLDASRCGIVTLGGR